MSQELQLERIPGDGLLHMDLMGGEARVLLCETTEMVQQMVQLHGSTPVCTAALGRLMTGAAMMGSMMKGEGQSVTLTVKGGGPMGTLVAVAEGGFVRACADNVNVSLPEQSPGKLDVGGAVGHEGYISVVKDLRMREPYVGQTELVSGEIAVDLANYFTVSEQQPSLVALGVLVRGSKVLKSGGLIIQPLPGCSEETLSQLELRSPMFAEISHELMAAPKEELAEDWFRGLDLRLLDRSEVGYRCNCSRNRMERALLAIGRQDLQEIHDDGKGAELVCHFCNRKYFFTTEDLQRLLEQGKQPRGEE
ncbi:MAG: Hsp33 family molecular chaperone HslO [Clostridia bacterium]|nr:Hsp33 family molecular chaperone HslO [Clostridia bacterium]